MIFGTATGCSVLDVLSRRQRRAHARASINRDVLLGGVLISTLKCFMRKPPSLLLLVPLPRRITRPACMQTSVCVCIWICVNTVVNISGVQMVAQDAAAVLYLVGPSGGNRTHNLRSSGVDFTQFVFVCVCLCRPHAIIIASYRHDDGDVAPESHANAITSSVEAEWKNDAVGRCRQANT